MAVVRFREPVFTFDTAKKAWGEAYWGLSGKQWLEWVKSFQFNTPGLGVLGMYDHRPFFREQSVRHVAWCIKPPVKDFPQGIIHSYLKDIESYPANILAEDYFEYQVQQSWSILMFKWDTLNIQPQKFNPLLSKLLAYADLNMVGLAVLDTVDLYVNYNPVEWKQKYDQEYPNDNLEAQREAYDKWITYSGFKRLYITDNYGRLFTTPWYYRIPVEGATFGSAIEEYPTYKPHPLTVTGGVFIPGSYDPEEDTINNI